MYPEQIFLIVGAGMLAGAINAVAGGGSFVTLPVLVFCGLPSTVANETSTIALWPGGLASFGVYRREIAEHPRLAVWMAIISLLGGTLGAWILLHTTPLTFDRLLPWLTLFATVLFICGRRLADSFELSLGEADGGSLLGMGSILFVIAIYGGYYGAGAGIVQLAALSLLGMKNIHTMNGLKTLANASFNASAVVMFLLHGAVHWPAALWMMAGGLAGGYGGAWLARRVPPGWVRRFVIFTGVATTIYFFYRAFGRA